MNVPFFGDIAWFYQSARDVLLLGKFPLLGITSSIIWLHQGPLWTYLLVPALLFFNYYPFGGIVFIFVLNIFLFPIFYYLILKIFNRKTAVLSTFFLIFLPWWNLQAKIPYHTSPIPLFEVIFLLCLIKQRDFLAGLFLGLLYQLHLLTFVFWPLLIFRFNKKSFLGFILGIAPFLFAGPVQTFGIFVWLAKHMFEGFGGTGLASEAYRVVLLVPSLILLSFLTHKLPKLLTITIYISLLIFFNFAFDISRYDFSHSTWWLIRVK